VQLLLGDRALCVDTYEASPGEDCPHQDPNNVIASQENVSTGSCQPVTQPDAAPWRFVSYTDAQQLCARVGKRLPNNDEWYRAVSGIAADAPCVLGGQGSPEPTGTANCVSPLGAHDLIGNVWEWVDAEVVEGVYNDRTLPLDGYVTAVDGDGVVSETSQRPQSDFGEDYAWTSTDGVTGMIRGGFYGSGTDGGIFSLNSSIATNFRATGIGFRCVRDI